jgi:TonB family protein
MKPTLAILFSAASLSAQLTGGNAAVVSHSVPAAHSAAAQDAAPQRVRVGGNVAAANLITKVAPVYPADMKAQRLEGTVLLQAVISKEGVPQSLNVQNADVNRAFVDAAIDAVKQWRYRPTLLNGEPVEVITTITVNFTLAQ